MKVRVGQLEVSYSARGIPTYKLDLWHDGLKKHRLIRGDSQSIIELKAQLQIDEWEERWAQVDMRNRQRDERDRGKRQQDERKSEAADRTEDARLELESLSGLLKASLDVDDRINWEELKERDPFPETRPVMGKLPEEPDSGLLPKEPTRKDAKYNPPHGILEMIFSSRRRRLQEVADRAFEADRETWSQRVSEIRRAHEAAKAKHAKLVQEATARHEAIVASWDAKRRAYLEEQDRKNAEVDAKKWAYESSDPEAIVEYMDLVLSSSKYPDYFPQEFDIDYDLSAKTAVVDYQLPSPDDLPRLKSVKYVASRDEFDEQFISDAQAARLYDDVLYQVVLRTAHELFESDTISALEAVVINGYVTSIDRTTGKSVTACVLSLRAGREEFVAINLDQVDPKACFKALKGVGSSKLSGLSPIPPIMQLRREDGRFVSSYGVAETLSGAVNLASMDWEDFEHLIREIFEKEFSSSGGEVRVTQASRDGGVDAVVFDPDPIRGGKIVIQAKRYTNTVGVGAVRDLYGTVLNEGASKGILVTTSDYGPDSYAFANGKPLVLLSGANLLHLLEKHGHSARIDIREAKQQGAA